MTSFDLELLPHDGTRSCPVCDSKSLGVRIEEDRFVYGTGAQAVELVAKIPVVTCQECSFEFTDSRADELKHEAICHHLDLLTPREIVEIRKRYNLSQAELARISKVGEASINRWENGLVIQNPAMDRYLRLISFPENLDRIRYGLAHGRDGMGEPREFIWKERVVYQKLEVDAAILKQEASFNL